MKRIQSITTYLTAGVMLATALLIFFCPFGFGGADAMAMAPDEATLCSGAMAGHAMGGAAQPCIPSHAALGGRLTGTLPDIMALLLGIFMVACFAIRSYTISKEAIPRMFLRFLYHYRAYQSNIKRLREQKFFRWFAMINDPAIAFSA